MAKKNNNISIEDLKDVILSETDEKYDLASEPSDDDEDSASSKSDDFENAVNEIEQEQQDLGNIKSAFVNFDVAENRVQQMYARIANANFPDK